MHPNYDPFVDIAWDDEQTPVLKQESQQEASTDSNMSKGTLYKSDGAQWPCYICHYPTDISLYKGRYSLRLHPECALRYNLVSANSR